VGWAYEELIDAEYELAYDALGRVTVRYDYNNPNRYYYYDDQWRLIAEYDESDTLIAKYVYGPEIDEPVRMTTGGANYYYHAAALGTVTEITSSTGTLVEQYSYDVYGEPSFRDGSGNPLSGSAISNRLLFQGRDRDPDTGLYNFRNRYYSATLGRFLQTDPIGVDGGFNLYAFVSNKPADRMDPFGMNAFEDFLAKDCFQRDCLVTCEHTKLIMGSGRRFGSNTYYYECTDCQGNTWEESRSRFWIDPVWRFSGWASQAPPDSYTYTKKVAY
jgi:RHS repeat-associated protein